MTTTQPLMQTLTDSIKKELDVNSFLETLTVESSIEHAKQFAISGWFLLKVVEAVIFLLATQVYKLGQVASIKTQPLKVKLYNFVSSYEHPVAKFIQGLLHQDIPTIELPITGLKVDNEGNIIPSTNPHSTGIIFPPTEQMGTQREPIPHTNS